MAYSKRNWSSGTTPLSKDNLEAMDEAIVQNSTDIEALKEATTAESLSKSIGVYPMIDYPGAPKESTAGKIGQLYLDTTTKKLFVCTYKVSNKYTWTEFALAQRKIAGIGLTADITSEQLLEALKVYPLITSSQAPTTDTVGHTGQMYICTTYDGSVYTYKLYYCAAVSNGEYYWRCIYDSSKPGAYSLTELDKQEIADIIKNEYEAELLAILGGDTDVTQ